MKWLARLLFFGRVRRLERLQKAAALLAAGRTDDAETLLRRARPTRWVDDLAVYHFVLGKLLMERNELEEAERHLQTSLGLGLDRPSVKLNLAVLKVRRCELASALSILDDVEASDDASTLEQARIMRQVISDAIAGAPLRELPDRIARFRKKHFDRTLVDGDLASTLRSFGNAIKDATLSSKDLEDAVLFYGHLIVEHRGGSWLVGLDPRDHRVLVDGVAFHPFSLLERFLSGRISALELGEPLGLLPEEGNASSSKSP